MIEVSLEERFQTAATDLVVVSQDRRLLHNACEEQQQQIEALQGRVKLLDQGQSVVLALLDCEASDKAVSVELCGRARAWLKDVGSGGG